MERKSFDNDDVYKILLWCDRHCCLCGKKCDTNIEVAHIGDRNDNSIDNAIPVCFDCHAKMGHYNKNHPRGRKFSHQEIKSRRDQIYDLKTQHLIGPIQYEITQSFRDKDNNLRVRIMPDVGFNIHNLGRIYPVKVKVSVKLYQGRILLGSPPTQGHYDGTLSWNLNPLEGVNGHFSLPVSNLEKNNEPLRAHVSRTVIDIYERKHELLPNGYVYDFSTGCNWYFEPVESLLLNKPRKKR